MDMEEREYWNSVRQLDKRRSEMSDIAVTFEEAAEVAIQKQCVVVVANSYQLALDLDGPEAVQEFIEQFPKLIKAMKASQEDSSVTWVSRVDKWASSTVGCYHVLITLHQEYSELELLLMQMFLGSDRQRELIGMQRWQRGERTGKIRILFRPESSAVYGFNWADATYATYAAYSAETTVEERLKKKDERECRLVSTLMKMSGL